jgi:hypothetical protein
VSHFCALTSFKSLYIVLDVCLNPRPPVVVHNELLGLIATRMSGRNAVMMKLDNLFSKPSTMWYIDTMFPSNELTIVIPVFLLVGVHECLQVVY